MALSRQYPYISVPIRSLGVFVAVSSLVVLGLGAPPAAAAPPSGLPSGDVIVMLRDQHTGARIAKGAHSARAQANLDSQRPVLSRARSVGASHLHSFTAINAFAAQVTSAQAAKLAADPAVSAIVPDLAIARGAGPTREGAAAAQSIPKPRATTGICPADPKPLLEPEAL